MMTINQSKKIAQDYFRAYEADDPDALMSFLHSDYILYPGGDGKPMNAKERRRDEAVFFSAFSHIKVSIEDQIAEGDKVANLFDASGIRLFARNIRGYLGRTEINRSMEHTISNSPQFFWYYNNGLTIVCDAA